jgi:hypothetical protein
MREVVKYHTVQSEKDILTNDIREAYGTKPWVRLQCTNAFGISGGHCPCSLQKSVMMARPCIVIFFAVCKKLFIIFCNLNTGALL